MLYRKPPITEAVIEFQFAGDCSPSNRKKIAHKLKPLYPIDEVLRSTIVEVGPGGVGPSVSEVGTKLSSWDCDEIVNLFGRIANPAGGEVRPAVFSASQLAPYCGWDAFLSRFGDNWAVAESILGHRKLSRIGVRFINRIDIPGEIDDVGRWVQAGPTLPARLPRPTAFTLHTVLPLDEAQANILVATAPSPLPHHSAILLDIDVYTGGAIDDQPEARLEILQDFRVKKNHIFESCITDAARDLFK